MDASTGSSSTTQLSSQPDRLGSWRPEVVALGATRKYGRAIIITAIALVAIAILAYFLLQPFANPDVHLVLIQNDPAELGTGPLYATGDSAAVDDFGERLHRYDENHPPVRLSGLDSPRDVGSLKQKLERIAGNKSSVLILYWTVRGESIEGVPYLIWPGNAKNPAGTRLRAADVLKQLAEHPAKTKLVLLDIRGANDATHGPIADEFPRQLKAAVEATRANSLWLLASHSALERSHLDHARRRSAFNTWAMRGLRGAADLDDDGSIGVGELRRYVTYGVSRSIANATGLLTTQTPLLCWGGGDFTNRERVKLVPVMEDVEAETATTDIGPLFPENLVLADVHKEVQTQLASMPANGRYPQAPVIARRIRVVVAAKTQAAANAAKKQTPETKTASKQATPPPKSPPLTKGGPGGVAAAQSVPQLFAAAWLWHDAATRRNSSLTATAVDDAPQILRLLQRRLLLCQRAYRTHGPFPKPKKKDKAEEADPPPANPVEQKLTTALTELIRLFRALREGRIELSTTASPLEKQVAAHLRSRGAVNLPAASLALLENSHRFAAPRNGFDVARLANDLDSLIADGDAPKLRAFTSNMSEDQLRLSEPRLAKRLADGSPARWQAIRAALQTRRFGEQVVALATGRLAWVRSTLEAADRHRLAGERRLLDGIGDDYEEWSLRRFARAVEMYDDALTQLKMIDSAAALRNNLAHALPGYVAWARRIDDLSTDGVTRLQRLTSLAQALRELSAILDSTVKPNIADLRRALSRTRMHRADLMTDFRRTILTPAENILAGDQPVPGDTGRFDAALCIPTLPAEERLTILRAMQTSVAGGDRPMSVPASPMLPPERLLSESDTERIAARAALAIAVWRLRLGDVEQQQGDLKALQAAAGSLDDWKAVREFDRLHRAADDAAATGLRSGVAGILSDDQPQPDWTAYTARLQRLERAARNTSVAGALNGESAFDRLVARGRIAAGVQMVAWQHDRQVRAAHDAPQAEAVALRKRTSDARTVLSRYLKNLPVPGRRAPLDATAPAGVSLRESASARFRLTLRPTRGDACPATVWVEYDPSVLSLRSVNETWLPRVMHGKNPVSLIAATKAKKRESLTVSPGESAVIPIEVTRKVATRTHPAKVVLHVVCDDTVVRRTVVVGLPSPRAIQLVASAVADVERLTAKTVAGPRLFPFPNRTTAFRFAASNLTGEPRTVTIDLLRLNRPLTRNLPEARVSAGTAAALLRLVGAGDVIATSGEVALPADDSGVALKFQAPAPAAKTQAAKASPAIINNGLLAVVTDKATKRVSLRAVAISPQRPRRFLDVRAGYEATRGLITVRVRAKDAKWLPAEPVAVRGEIAGEAQPQPSLSGLLKREDREAVLTGVVSDRNATVTLQLHVDGFPRAFLFRFRGVRSLAVVPELLTRRSLQIVTPKSGAVFGANDKQLQVTFRVDAPVGSFQNGRDGVEIGIDINRDRVLKNEPALRFPSDRQTTVMLEKIAEDGGLEIKTAIGDFTVSLPTRGVPSSRVDLLGLLDVAGDASWSNSRPIVFDQRSPLLAPVRSVRIAAGKPARFVVQADDSKLSGVQKIELFIDQQRTGTFPKEGPLVNAEATGTGTWAATLKSEELSPGNYPVLVRAVDAAGNVSETQTARLIVQSKSQAAADGAAKPNRVEGVLTFDKDPVPGAVMTLEPAPADPKQPPPATPPAKVPPVKTDAKGAFVFPKIPPGEYTLTAFKRNLANKNRRRSVKIKVASPPAPAVSVPLRLR